MMMSDSETKQPQDDKEKTILLNKLIRERFGEWATKKNYLEREEKEAE